jgi:hypothetical protein
LRRTIEKPDAQMEHLETRASSSQSTSNNSWLPLRRIFLSFRFVFFPALTSPCDDAADALGLGCCCCFWLEDQSLGVSANVGWLLGGSGDARDDGAGLRKKASSS